MLAHLVFLPAIFHQRHWIVMSKLQMISFHRASPYVTLASCKARHVDFRMVLNTTQPNPETKICRSLKTCWYHYILRIIIPVSLNWCTSNDNIWMNEHLPARKGYRSTIFARSCACCFCNVEIFSNVVCVTILPLFLQSSSYTYV